MSDPFEKLGFEDDLLCSYMDIEKMGIIEGDGRRRVLLGLRVDWPKKKGLRVVGRVRTRTERK